MPADLRVSLDLAGKVSVVTGAGRRQGIGAAICLALASHGADVFFTYWHHYDRADGIGEDLDGPGLLEQQIRDLGVRSGSLEVDLADPDSAALVLDRVRDTLGPPAILVNNAAHSTLDDYRAGDSLAGGVRSSRFIRIIAITCCTISSL